MGQSYFFKIIWRGIFRDFNPNTVLFLNKWIDLFKKIALINYQEFVKVVLNYSNIMVLFFPKTTVFDDMGVYDLIEFFLPFPFHIFYYLREQYACVR